MHFNDRSVSVWGFISPSFFLLLPSSLEWNSLPWLVVLLLWIDLRRVLQFCFPLGTQPSAYRSYKGFSEVIIPIKSFPAVSETFDVRDLNHLSELQVGLWEENYRGARFSHVSLLQLYGPKEISWTYFLGGNYVCLIQVLWISLQGCKMMLSEPRAHGRWKQDVRPTSFRAGATSSHFFEVCPHCSHDTARTWMGKRAWG